MIPIRNVYHMLAYAFHLMKDGAYVRCATESFHNIAELLAEILIKGISIQRKRGLLKGYTPISEQTGNIKGKLNISESIHSLAMLNAAMVCDYDVFVENCYPNRILKTTALLLLKHNISSEQKRKLQKLMFYFQNVETIALQNINWHFHYNRNNQHYQLLMYVCQMVLQGLIQTTSDGIIKLKNFIDDERMCHLYEKFIFNFYRKEHPELQTSSEQIPWSISELNEVAFLPTMQTDVVLRNKKNTLIIDAKFYNNNLCSKYGGNKHLHSSNAYQIYTYVDNYRKLYPHEQTHGLLLYAKTDALIQPNTDTDIFSVRTLDLTLPFPQIAEQLHKISHDFLS